MYAASHENMNNRNERSTDAVKWLIKGATALEPLSPADGTLRAHDLQLWRVFVCLHRPYVLLTSREPEPDVHAH